MQAFRLEPDEAEAEPGTPPRLSPASLPQTEHLPEVSMVEAADVTGVSFSPEYVDRPGSMRVLPTSGERHES